MVSSLGPSRQNSASKASSSKYERHFVYWYSRRLSNGNVGILAIQHGRMRQIDRLKKDFHD